jgi:hypothetical protein
MKSLIKAIVVAAAVLAVPAVSFAQSTVTRAQVQAELAQVRGVHPSLYDTGDAHYPDGIQHAEAAAVAQSGAAVNSGYGASTNGSSQAGASGNAPVYNQYLGSPYARP